MIALPARLYADLIGKPFLTGARGPDAYDCVGLAIEMQRRQGRDVPDYGSTPEELARVYDPEAGIFGPCRKVSRPEVGCVVLMRGLGGTEMHLGTLVDPFRMLHAHESAKSVVTEVLNRTYWGNRILGYYVIGGAL
jgi:cell wall-associated NlpC family hydrolase